MRSVVKKDILRVLRQSLKAVSDRDVARLSAISNETIHDASIYQDEDSLTIAILMYSIAKVFARCIEKGRTCPLIEDQISLAMEMLEADDINGYRSAVKEVLSRISALDTRLRMYVQEVIDQAKMKKAGKLHEHGISVARTAELLGLSQWEVQQYIGKVAFDGKAAVRARKRLSYARGLFK
ncbi:hypothetical protein D6825_00805 [Candidatus Woesearchaeota archaeon]|nr:MAG: hypothetical protein D6825_00805 [Candidatus Woesearchaeota archaeon]